MKTKKSTEPIAKVGDIIHFTDGDGNEKTKQIDSIHVEDAYIAMIVDNSDSGRSIYYHVHNHEVHKVFTPETHPERFL